MNLYFEVYKSSSNLLYYWRLRKISIPSKYSFSNDDFETDEIIATGHQGYQDIESAKNDIKKVISAIPGTTIKVI